MATAVEACTVFACVGTQARAHGLMQGCNTAVVQYAMDTEHSVRKRLYSG